MNPLSHQHRALGVDGSLRSVLGVRPEQVVKVGHETQEDVVTDLEHSDVVQSGSKFFLFKGLV